LNAPKIFEKNIEKQTRDIWILLILYWSGLRVSELINLRIEDINKLKEWNQISIIWKWLKLRSVFISEKAKKQLDKYQKYIKHDKWYLFTSLSNNSKNRRLSRVSIEKIVKNYSQLIWIKKELLHIHLDIVLQLLF
jgi:site-specific recombinase XerD